MNIEDHPLGRRLPKPNNKGAVSIHDDPTNFRLFAAREDHPETLDDYLYHDTPILSLHITSLNDATLVALAWPHCIMDVLGQQALLKGWCLVMAGRESELPPLLGARQDTMAALAEDKTETQEEFLLSSSLISGFAFGNFVFRLLWDKFWNPPLETHIVFMPKPFLNKLQAQAREDLAGNMTGEEKETPFVSEGDVITAWMTRLIASSLLAPRPITVLHAVNTRLRLPALKQSSGLYVQNMALGAFTFLSAEVTQDKLGVVAMENRQHLAKQATKGQMLAFLRHLRPSSKTAMDPAHVLCGPSDALLLPFTNWEKADFFNVIDFSPAVKSAGATGEMRTNASGRMVHHHAQSLQESAPSMNVVVVLGKDHADNYWLSATLLPSTWAKIKESLITLA